MAGDDPKKVVRRSVEILVGDIFLFQVRVMSALGYSEHSSVHYLTEPDIADLVEKLAALVSDSLFEITTALISRAESDQKNTEKGGG